MLGEAHPPGFSNHVTFQNSIGYLATYIDIYLREEVVQEGLTRNVSAFARFLEVASFSQGAVINATEVAREVGVNRQIIQKLVYYLKSIKYWEDQDNGMWEENKEIHASSVGSCLAGLKTVQSIAEVPQYIITAGEDSLNNLLPRESKQKETDLSLLSLIYPYNIISKSQSTQILNNIERLLCRKKGVIRYKNDQYYNRNNKEASWTMGFPWLSICFYKLNNIKKYKYYLQKSISCLNDNLEMPELYIEDKIANKNIPLGWSQSMLITALSF